MMAAVTETLPMRLLQVTGVLGGISPAVGRRRRHVGSDGWTGSAVHLRGFVARMQYDNSPLLPHVICLPITATNGIVRSRLFVPAPIWTGG